MTTLPVPQGGTGQQSFTDGQILIGDSTTGCLNKNTITAGAGLTITNGHGSITIAGTGGGGVGSVTSVSLSAPLGGGTVTTSGTLGTTSFTSGSLLTGNGTGALTLTAQATASTGGLVVVDARSDTGFIDYTFFPWAVLAFTANELAIGNAASGKFLFGVIANNDVSSVVGQAGTSAGPLSVLRRSRGTWQSPSLVLNNDSLGSFVFSAWNGNAAPNTGGFTAAASIQAVITEATPSVSALGTQLLLGTTPNGSVTVTLAVTIDQDQSVLLAGVLRLNSAHYTASTILLTDASKNAISGVVGSGLSLSAGGTLTATGSGGTVTSVSLSGPWGGGTVTTTGTLGTSSLTAHSVLIGNGAGAVNLATIGTAGRVLTDQGAADPAFVALASGAGISVTQAGTVTITNTGVVSLVAGTNISLSAATGTVTVNATGVGSGSVTSVKLASTNLAIGGTNPVTTSGTITADLTAGVGLTFGSTGTISLQGALPNGQTATTQAATDNTTKVATDAFVQTVVANAIAGVNPAVAVSAATWGHSSPGRSIRRSRWTATLSPCSASGC